MIFNLHAWAQSDVEPPQPSAIRPAAMEHNWSLLLPNSEKVSYKGIANFDDAGAGTMQMLYPAPDAAGLLAAVLTHGFLAESAKNSQKDKLQQAADSVLTPYEAVLSGYTHKELMQRGLQMMASSGARKLVDPAERSSADWHIESTPVFSITQDQSAFVLHNVISIYRPGAASAAAYQYTVKVVSQPRDEADLPAFWTANNGEKLKEESARLFAESLDIALGEAAGRQSTNGSYRTIRYMEGGAERMERGLPISERCNRVLMKTLRDWLMSVPTRRGAAGAAAATCEK
ncbi:MAG: hypothetical protein IH605_06125 [Burkholderiales bacterium]|nr:hypothetical protein [Burkholderiales bacterium]